MQGEKYFSRRVLYEMLCASHGDAAKKIAYLFEFSVKNKNESLLKDVKELIDKYGTERIEKKTTADNQFVMVIDFNKVISEMDMRGLVYNLFKKYDIEYEFEDEKS